MARQRKKIIITVTLLCCFVFFCDVNAQEETGVLNTVRKKEIIEKISKLLKDNYVFPNLGEKYGQEILAVFKSGQFDNITNSKEFCAAVTGVLQKLMKDKHLLLRLIEASDLGEDEHGSLHHPLRYYRLGQEEHLGIFRLDWLENGIGYLDYRRFYTQEKAKEMLLHAVQFLSSANAIIIDLRKNQGGSGSLIPLLLSYFLEYPTQLTGTYYRNGDITEEWWIHEKVKGKRLLDVPLFLLIGKNTFSAAEYLAYDLKVRKRAILVGETTKGGAHSVDLFKIGEGFEIYIPTARAVNPVTGSNWEGTGVIPDVAVPEKSALDTAIGLAKKAAREYGKVKDKKNMGAVDVIQRQLDQAEMLYKKGKKNEAKIVLNSAFQKAVETGIVDEFFLQVLAHHYSSIQAQGMAIAVLNKLVEFFPHSASGYFSLAWAYYKKGDKVLARKNFKKVLELDNHNSLAKQLLKKL
jgi:tetratricopeptide (TPR) repeat protein